MVIQSNKYNDSSAHAAGDDLAQFKQSGSSLPNLINNSNTRNNLGLAS